MLIQIAEPLCRVRNAISPVDREFPPEAHGARKYAASCAMYCVDLFRKRAASSCCVEACSKVVIAPYFASLPAGP